MDNVVLNAQLVFRFSEDVNASTVSNASIQIREGPSFGQSVAGAFVCEGAVVRFEPRLPGLCDLSDGGLDADRTYRVQVVGSPAEFAVRNTHGQPLAMTSTYEFHTRIGEDPTKFADQIPGAAPQLLHASPQDGDQAVTVADGNQVVLTISENLDPCSVSTESVLFHVYQLGDMDGAVPAPNTNNSGFYAGTSTADQTPLDPYTWGADKSTTLPEPQRILADVELVQDFDTTQIIITPQYGRFPENALVVVELTPEIADFGSQLLTPVVVAFTTENLDEQQVTYVMECEGETPFPGDLSTADVNSARAPSRVQGFMLFAGDGDNGASPSDPSLPNSTSTQCQFPLQPNDGIKDDFDPSQDTVLDTGSSTNTCANSTDGSTAVVWEFKSFRIRGGVTVRVTGVNPAIILVQGDVVIEVGGRLLVRGDGLGGSPQGNGTKGKDIYNASDTAPPGGVGVAGGGDGGDAATVQKSMTFAYGQDGFSGYASDDYDPTMNPGGSGHGGLGAGLAGAPSGTAGTSTYNPWDGGGAGGGGGGHAIAGTRGDKNAGTVHVLKLPARGDGGEVYGDDKGRLLVPEAGSGGGSAGAGTMKPFQTSTTYGASGGGGGAGGGFLDFTSSGNISIFGTIDASGGRGGAGAGWNGTGQYGASGGGGGGSGGGLRILTPNEILLTSTAVVTAAGGLGGKGYKFYSVNQQNDGGDGGTGRLALEDSDSVIAGLGSAVVVPNEGTPGFYRGIFDASRFKGGGLTPQAESAPFAVGPMNPRFLDPVQNYGGQTDFEAGVPVVSSTGAGSTRILVEVQGFEMLPDASADASTATGFYTVGWFTDSGVEGTPTWNMGGQPGDVTVPTGNVGFGIDQINGCEYIQVRVTVYLKSGIGPFDPGAFIDRWSINFRANQ